MSSNIEKKLKETVKANPLTKTEKNVLWAKIEGQINKKEQSVHKFSIFNMFSQSRLALASLLVLILIGSSIVTVVAADSAKPGDILFPIDIAVEKIQLVFSSNKKKDELRIKFAKERVSEVKIILSFGMSDSSSNNSNQSTTSTDQNTTSTDSQNTTSTSPQGSGGNSNFQQAETAFVIALEQLEEAKSKLEEKENTIAVAVIDQIISELTDLAQDHVDELEKFEAKIKIGKDDQIKIKIKASSDKLKTEFKFKQKKGGDDVKITYSVKAKKDKHRDDYDEDDNDNDDNTTSTPDTIAPVISNINSSVSTNTANISWNTDEGSDSVVWYSTTTPLIVSNNTLSVDSSNIVTAHNISLSDLSVNTTYYFIISSTDESNNEATSTESSFTTLTPDTTAPIISNISLSVSTNTADIIWNTDEPSNSKAWYSTTTPIVLGSSSFIESTNLVASHAVSLSSLNASTTYYFIVGSTDEFNNEATSTESSFTTL